MIHGGNLPDPKQPLALLPAIYRRAVIDAVIKLDPRQMIRNPVMFVVEAGSALTTLLWLQALTGNGEAPAGFIGAISAWLWFTVLFANFAEALAEGRGKAQAESLRKMRQDTMAKKLYLGYEIAKGREPVTLRLSCCLILDSSQDRSFLCEGRGYDPG